MALPSFPPSSCSLVKFVTFAEPSRLLPCRSKASRFAVLNGRQSPYNLKSNGATAYLVDRLHDPVNARVTTDSLVLGIN